MDTLISTVIGDVALVLVISALFGWAARKCGQPAVIGQIIGGIALGPTLLGRLPGHLTSRLFPPATLPPLTILAQVAVVIFMFSVGYEIDLRLLRGHRRAVPLVAASALLVPMALGAGATLLFRSQFRALGEPDISRPLVIFMAVALSITALPVLAAIVRERGLAGSIPGVTATSAAGIMDVLAWLALAAALVGTGHSGRPWAVTVLLTVAFIAAMLLLARPATRWWVTRRGSVLSDPVPVAMVLALGSAWVTASLGLHPVFGGFLAGLIMPRPDGAPDAAVLRRMEQVGGLLLPLFFLITGLSLDVGGLGVSALIVFVVVCAIASLGKLGPGYAAARAGGLGRPDAAAVAVLVNTRGLTELIALNVGLSVGLIDQRLFTVLVLMAVLTTLLTAPLLTATGVPSTEAAVAGPLPVPAPPPASPGGP